MRLHEIAKREEEDNEFAELLRNCGPYLRATGGISMLYRGILGLKPTDSRVVDVGEGDSVEVWRKVVRTDRQPRDTKKAVHDAVNDALEDQFGWRPRSEGMFCFGDGYDADAIRPYGPVYAVFPYGPIEYIWSPRVKDLWDSLLVDLKDESPEHVAEVIRSAGYRSTGLKEAAGKDVEIMIKCKGYYAVPAEDADLLFYPMQLALRRGDFFD